MNKNANPNTQPQTPPSPHYTREDGGGAPGPKHSIPCPPPTNPRKK